MIPALCHAIWSMVFPNMFVCSRAKAVITATDGRSTMLVESKRPPIPTSMMATSRARWVNVCRAIRVRKGKNPGRRIPAAVSESRTWKNEAAKSSSEMSWPLTRIRSLGLTRCGDVKSPVRFPAAPKRRSKYPQVDPFPLEPATWMTRRRSRSAWVIPRLSR